MKRVTEPKLRAGRGDTVGGNTSGGNAGSTDSQVGMRSSMGKLRLSWLVRYSCSSFVVGCLPECLSVFLPLWSWPEAHEHAPTPHRRFTGYPPFVLRPQGGLTHSRPMHRESIMPVLTPRALAAPRYWVPVDDEDLWCLARVESRSGGSVKLSRSRAPPGCVRVPHGLACRPYRAPYVVWRAGCSVGARYHAGHAAWTAGTTGEPNQPSP